MAEDPRTRRSTLRALILSLVGGTALWRFLTPRAGAGPASPVVSVPEGGSVVHDFNLSSDEVGENIVKLSEFKVSGAREGNAKAIVEQRVAVNLKTVMASDAYFPFRDGIDNAAAAGISAVIQPGGSIRDAEVIAAVDEHGMAMVFTGMRHFRH